MATQDIRRLVVACLAATLLAGPARAGTELPPAGATAAPPLVVEGGLVLGLPAALSTGLSTGVGAGVTRGGGALAFGARASWSSASEYALAWAVRHDDLRLRVFAALQHRAGRGTLGLRLGAGGTLVRERRIRDQGSRAGLTGDELATTAWALLPALDLELAVALRVSGAWCLALSGGPSVGYLDGAAHAGFTSFLGVAWQR